MFAHKILKPLFSYGEGKRIRSIYGSIKIEKNWYENEFERDLLKVLNIENGRIIKLNSCEAIVE